MSTNNYKFKQTELGEIPEDWSINSLGNLCEIKGGKRLPFGHNLTNCKTNHPYIRIVDMGKESINKESVVWIEDKTYEKISRYTINENDVYISIVGTIGLTGLIDKFLDGANLTENAAKLFNFNEVIPSYVNYYLKSFNGQEQIKSQTVGSTQPKLALSRIQNILITLPTVEEQKQIASILSSLDDKIELNQKTIKTLEEIGQAIFKRWFIDFEFPNEKGEPYKSSGGEMVGSELGEIPKWWIVKKISDTDVTITDFVANGSFASLKENVTIKDKVDYALFLRNTDLKNDFSTTKKYVDKHAYEFLKKTKMFGGEVIISSVGDVGSVFLCPDFDIPMTLGNNVIALKSDFNNFYYFLFKSPLGQDLIKSITAGSVQMKFNKTDFRNIQLIYPNKQIIEKFTETADLLIKKINSLKREIVDLVDLKDSLLPKLLNGKIRIESKEHD